MNHHQFSEGIKYFPYNPHHDSPIYIDGIISCYQESFAGEPWNESHICPNCEEYWGQVDIEKFKILECPTCHVPLREFWPAATVREDFLNETQTIPEKGRVPACWIAVDGNRVVGICWGYLIRPRDLEKKLELPCLADSIRHRFGKLDVVAYQDELAITPEYRGRHIASRLVRGRHTEFLDMGVTHGIIRTKRNPPSVTYEWYTKSKGYEIIAEYHDPEDRVVLGRSYKGLTF